MPELTQISDRARNPETNRLPGRAPDFQWKLWIYTNYDCHLRCKYCLAESSPQAPRRALSLETVRKVVDEAVSLGFTEIFFTGGEPFILDEIYAMLDYASQRVKTTVLTSGALLKGKHLEKLQSIASSNLIVQVSLDGGRPGPHDAYRGRGTWAQTVAAVQRLQEHGFHVRLSTTITPANANVLDEICRLHRSMGIPEEDHLIRPLARRGAAAEGISVSMANTNPEITINQDGAFWHPISTDADMQVTRSIFPLADAVYCVQEQLQIIAAGGEPRITFT